MKNIINIPVLNLMHPREKVFFVLNQRYSIILKHLNKWNMFDMFSMNTELDNYCL